MDEFRWNLDGDGLTRLTVGHGSRMHVFQHAQVVEFHAECLRAEGEVRALLIEDLRPQFLHCVDLAVLVESGQLVHAVDVEPDVDAGYTFLLLWKNLLNVIVLCERLITLHECHLLPEEHSRKFVYRFFGIDVHLCLNLSRLVDLAIKPNPIQSIFGGGSFR